ncbi:MAG: DUF1517 domain-containing protein [Sandaracinaceae bacterium]|nr:DUF1517 domain-containing protein [Sandaracinaceae bacterium]
MPCFLVLLIGLVVLRDRWRRRRSGARTHGARGWARVDVSALQLGIDWRARAALQSRLEALARSGSTSSPAGLARLLRETVVALRRAEASWLYAAVASYRPMSPASAEGIFRQLAVDARSRFRTEVLRNADGEVREGAAPPVSARADEGDGVVVVTLVVAARREILDVERAGDVAGLKRLLDELEALASPEALVAMEVVWSPAVETDRMSTAELESLYAHMTRLEGRSIAGRVRCDHCGGPFAAELRACPRCGAPAIAPGAAAET